MRRIILIAAVLLLIVGCGFYFLHHSSVVVVVDNQLRAEDAPAPRRVSIGQVDHSVWDRLLKKYVDDDGLVDYQAWKSSPKDAAALKSYLAVLSRADTSVDAPKAAKLTFWINTYNALTVHGILEVYPTTSIREHTPVAAGYNIWKDLLLPVGDKKYSLEDIEHEILRKLNEPRIHFAIVCGAVGCPRLRNEAYTPAALESQLADNARDFFSRSRNLQVDPKRRVLNVSSILDWFGEDFGTTPQEGLAGLAEYMPEDAARIAREKGLSIRYLDYDWNLNRQKTQSSVKDEQK